MIRPLALRQLAAPAGQSASATFGSGGVLGRVCSRVFGDAVSVAVSSLLTQPSGARISDAKTRTPIRGRRTRCTRVVSPLDAAPSGVGRISGLHVPFFARRRGGE